MPAKTRSAQHKTLDLSPMAQCCYCNRWFRRRGLASHERLCATKYQKWTRWEWAIYGPCILLYGLLLVWILSLFLSGFFSNALGPWLSSAVEGVIHSLVYKWKWEETAILQDLRGNKTHYRNGTVRPEVLEVMEALAETYRGF